MAAAQQRDPRPWEPGVGRVRERDGGYDGDFVCVDVGLEEAVEQYEGVGAGLVQGERYLAHGAEVGAEFDRDGHGDGVLDATEDVDVSLFDVTAGGARIAGQVVGVQFDGGGAGILHRARVVGPARGSSAVKACDHGDRHGAGGALEQAEIAVRSGVLFDAGGEVAERLGEAFGGVVDEPGVERGLFS
jgi:hypothetical protein